MPCRLRHLVLLVAVLLPAVLSAQAAKQRIGKLHLGLGLSGYNYRGDLTTRDGFQGFYPGGDLFLSLAEQRRVFVVFHAGIGRFAADDELLPAVDGVQPNTFAETDFYCFDLMLRTRLWRTAKVRPHLGLGVGILQFNVRDARGNDLADRPDTRALGETGGSGGLYVPLNVGASWPFAERFTLAFDYRYLVVASDYLDNIGELGPASGNDALHQLTLSLVVALNLGKP